MNIYHAESLSAVARVVQIPVVKATDLTLAYPGPNGSNIAVDKVSLQIAQGERLVLLGQSGCGKSSILKALAGFLKPAGGRLPSISGLVPDRIVVFQEFDQLLPWKTAAQNVAFPLRRARGLGKPKHRSWPKMHLNAWGFRGRCFRSRTNFRAE